jgi:hypothetical protein
MAAITIAGTRENPLAVGGHWQIVNVGWPTNGTLLVVEAYAQYPDDEEAGARTGTVAIDTEGRKVNGVVLAQRTFHVKATETQVGFTRVLAVMAFTRLPKVNTSAFKLTLGGTRTITDTTNPATVTLFCGTTTTIVVGSPIFAQQNPVNPNLTEFFRSETTTISTPAGTTTSTVTFGPLADLSQSDVGKGAFSRTATDNEIWYIDQFGNYVDTHRPCSELTPGGPPVAATKTLGFNYIKVATLPLSRYEMKKVADWTAFDTVATLVQVKPGEEAKAFPGPYHALTIPQVVVGTNSDFLPIFDDLPGADYKFALQVMTFEQFAAQIPPQKSDAKKWSLPGTYPIVPAYARYHFLIGTKDSHNVWSQHRTTPIYNGTTPAPFAPGSAPAQDTNFTP